MAYTKETALGKCPVCGYKIDHESGMQPYARLRCDDCQSDLEICGIEVVPLIRRYRKLERSDG